MLDVFGPAEVFTDANRLRGEPAYEVGIISAGDDRMIASHVGAPLLAHRTFRELRTPVDTLLVAGGDDPSEMRYSPDFLGWLREQSTNVRRLGSVCTGALVLADANLLDGRRATTHWNWCSELVQKHPLVKIDPDPIHVRDNNIYTSAGVTAGIDLALALVEEDLGSALALQIARMMVAVQRDAGGSRRSKATTDGSACLDHGPCKWRSLGRFARPARRHEPAQLRSGLQPGDRSDPGAPHRNRPVEAARRLLETTSLSLEEVADTSGCDNAEILRRAFVRRLGVSPRRYRNTFGPTHPH